MHEDGLHSQLDAEEECSGRLGLSLDSHSVVVIITRCRTLRAGPRQMCLASKMGRTMP